MKNFRFSNCWRFSSLVLLSLSLLACVSTAKVDQGGNTAVTSPSLPRNNVVILPRPDKPSYVHNSAVSRILDKAGRLADQQRIERAIQELERGLAIAPKNPFIWQKLAEIRLRQGRYAQAEQLASKSSILGRGDNRLQRKNQQIIAAAQRARRAE